LESQQLDAIEQALAPPLGNEIDALARPLLELVREARRAPQLQVGLHAQPEWPLQPAIRDIHHDHVLFTGDEVTGLIDFGALRIDTPLADVARLVGSLAGDDQADRDFALAAYSEQRPLSAVDRQWIDWLDRSGLVLGGLNWLTWLYLDRRDMGDPARVQQRLADLCRRLQRIC
jgi:homoserine kinase type II